MNFNEAKNRIAVDYGFSDWGQVMRICDWEEAESYTNEAAELYAHSAANEAVNNTVFSILAKFDEFEKDCIKMKYETQYQEGMIHGQIIGTSSMKAWVANLPSPYPDAI